VDLLELTLGGKDLVDLSRGHDGVTYVTITRYRMCHGVTVVESKARTWLPLR
jgi:hypothetical protein